MSKFKINFQLKEPDQALAFGDELNRVIHWFGLTDGLLWIDVNGQTIYEYNEEAEKYFGCDIHYNDYQIARFLEDFADTFWYIRESIPEELYTILDEFNHKAAEWNDLHLDDEDDAYIQFCEKEYSELITWYASRSFDSGHLVGGPCIGCFRCGENIKILWESTFEPENGSNIWTSPKGIFEMPYDEFILAVTEFFDSFFLAMDKQVEKAVAIDWEDISLDKERLVKENEERKAGFYDSLSCLKKSYENTDWNKVEEIYEKMERELQAAKS